MAILKDEEMGEMRIALEQMTKERNSLQEKIDNFIRDANDDLRIKLVLMKRPEAQHDSQQIV